MTSCCRWFIQPAREISKSRKRIKGQSHRDIVAPQSALLHASMAFCFQRDRVFGHYGVSDNAIVSREYDGRPACELHGKCMFGCPIGSKASTDLTYWPKALRKGAVLRTWARVREISVGTKGGASGAVYYDREGKLHEQPVRFPQRGFVRGYTFLLERSFGPLHYSWGSIQISRCLGAPSTIG